LLALASPAVGYGTRQRRHAEFSVDPIKRCVIDIERLGN
jgi:hypothetical protein